MPSSGETTGAVRMICNVEKTRILPHHLPVSLTTIIEPCSDTQNLLLLPRPSPASTSKDPIQIPLSEECPPPQELLMTAPEVQRGSKRLLKSLD
ncbi:hypothetical protein TYRP_008929 [Tyrophagus putrescentiae]|nr:hypothetical protein TYRP_008929 [Tyrophagus putrescentiae]